jgi:hypothetical protein
MVGSDGSATGALVMSGETSDVIRRQLDVAWRLTSHHLDGLTTAECLWSPASRGPRLLETRPGVWHAELPEHERYELGPASIGWLSWHLGYWWSMVLNHSFGDASLTAARVAWPGSGSATVQWITDLHAQWHAALTAMPAEGWQARDRTRWPFTDRSFADLAAWANIELMKNAAEIGYVRFLYAVQTRQGLGSGLP